MTDIGKAGRPDLILAGGDKLDGPVGPLAGYLRALEARVAALERRLSAVPLMTAADAAPYARVDVETILHAVRGGELPVAGWAAAPAGSPAMPSSAGSLPDHPERRRVLAAPPRSR
jgi:hypothetical protein